MKTIAKIVGGVLLAMLAYLLLWPIPITPVSVSLSPAPGYVGVHAANTRLSNLHAIDLNGDVGPEHIVFGADGKLYTAVASGNILRMQADGSALEVLVNTGGRPLGLDFDAAGNLIAADTVKGLISIAPDKTITVLANTVGGEPIRFADAVVVAQDGKIYFTDASARFAPKDWGGTFEASVLDLMEGSSTGRVLVFDPADKSTHIVAKGLSFANGITLTTDQQSLLVNETGKFRVWKLATKARDMDVRAIPTPAQASILLDNLPGYPDNLMRGRNGRIWLGLAAPRSPDADQLADKPFIRSIVMRLPRALWPVPKTYGHVMAFTEDGKIVTDLQDPSGAYPETTSVTETADRLYVQSLHAHHLGWMAIPR
jgi:sugar lactone lactonase YvrE